MTCFGVLQEAHTYASFYHINQKLPMTLGEGYELGGTQQGEVRRMRGQHQSLAAVILQFFHTMGGLDLKSRCRPFETG
jgi:hypothetical protein